MRPQTTISIYRRVWKHARPFRIHLVGMLALSLAATPLVLINPVAMKIVVDSVLGKLPPPRIIQTLLPGLDTPIELLGVAIGLLLLTAALERGRDLAAWVLETYTGEKLVLQFRSDLFRHIQRLSISYHDQVGSGDSIYRIQQDASAVQFIAIWGIIPFVSAGITLVSIFIVIAGISFKLAIVALAVSPALYVLVGFSRKKLRDLWHEVKEQETNAMSVVQEAVSSIRVVKAFGQEDKEHDRWAVHSNRVVTGQVRLARIGGTFYMLVGLTVAAGTAMVLWLGVKLVMNGQISLGALLIVMAYLGNLYKPLETISQKIGELQSSLASAERAFSTLDAAPDVPESPNAIPISSARGEVEFRNVRFSYDGRRDVIDDISFRIKPGTKVGIAGTTGAGKTTLMGLLNRFYDPSSGAILLDGTDLREYKLMDLRNQFALVLQDPVLFSSTISENIAYGRPGAHSAEIVEAAIAANAHDFIAALPDGYATKVGARGMMLSGGERQRISLARAFLKNAPILILDEPTSSVDPKTEGVIIEALERLMSGRTTFMIAHRLSTLEICDIRLKIEHGRLVEAGSPSLPRTLAEAISGH